MPTRYYMEGVVTNVLFYVNISCTPEDLSSFLPPPNTTCGEYMPLFLKNATGYITNETATRPESCEYCLYAHGQEYYSNFLGWSFDNRWRNLGIVLAYWFVSVL